MKTDRERAEEILESCDGKTWEKHVAAIKRALITARAEGFAAGVDASAKAVELFLLTDRYAYPGNIPSVIRALASPAPCEHPRKDGSKSFTYMVCEDCGATSADGVNWRKA